MDEGSDDAFQAFVAPVGPRLHRAFLAAFGPERGQEATAEALAYAWEHFERLRRMRNPAGYLYRVGQTKTRPRRSRAFPPPERIGLPDVEPTLVSALEQLTENQRVCVVLIECYQWTHQEVADLLDVTRASVQSHARRGLEHLRRSIGVEADV